MNFWQEEKAFRGGISDIQNREMEKHVAFDKGKEKRKQGIGVDTAPYTFNNSEWEPKLRDIH